MLKITGLDKLQKELKDTQRAFAELDGNLGSVQLDPHNPESIESAINKVNQIVDERVGHYSSNSIIGPLAVQINEAYHEKLLQSAAEARLLEDKDE